MGLFSYPIVDQPGLMMCRPEAIVAMAARDLPHYKGSIYYLWRPWITEDFRDLTPWEWRWYAHHQWEYDGRPHFDGLQFMNEPWIDSPGVTAQEINAWGAELVPILRDTWPGVDIYAPPISPIWPDYRQKWESLRPLVKLCDLLAVHVYRPAPWSYYIPRQVYPDKQQAITEYGEAAGGTEEYGRHIAWYWRVLEAVSYVRWVAPFVWNAPADGKFAAWRIEGTAAARVLGQKAGTDVVQVPIEARA